MQIPDQSGALPDPVLMLNAMNIPTDSFDLDQEAMTQLQVGISQSIPFPGKRWLKEEASLHQAKASEHMVEEAQQKLIRHVTSTWWQIFFIDRTIEIINTNQKLFRQSTDIAKKKYEVGKGLQQDVLLAQLELSKILDKEIQLEAMRRNEAAKLKSLMGVSPQYRFELPRSADVALDDVEAEEVLLTKAKHMRPLLSEKEEKLKSAKKRLDLAEKGYYPDFNVSVIYGYRQGDNPAMMGGGERSDFLSTKLGITIPLYAGRKQSKQVRQREEELVKSRYDLLDTSNNVSTEISVAYSNFSRAKEQYLLYKTGIIPQSRQTVESMLSGYQVSKVDFLNLIRSQVTLLNYEIQYWKAYTDTKKYYAQLLAAIGTGEKV